ncbi:DNA adenine methylase [Viscerimonas tarda]
MRTPITYYGGKQNMLKFIRPLIPAHELYCEPFCGGAALFFDKEPAKVNVINDLNSELITFYKVVATQSDDFRAEVLRTLHCRQQHEHAWHIYNHSDFFSDIQRAWAVWALSKMGFAGQLSSSFGFDKSECRHPKKMTNAKLSLVIDEGLKNLLEKTTIECDDAFKIIARYDCPQAFHFIDPPYVGSNMGHYSGMFNEQNLTDLLNLCATLKGKFMLTMYPNEIIKEFADKQAWHIHAVERNVTACKAVSRRKQEEWMVVNYEI